MLGNICGGVSFAFKLEEFKKKIAPSLQFQIDGSVAYKGGITYKN